ILRSEGGSAELTDELEKAKLNFEDVHTYIAHGKTANRIFCNSDYIVFASGSSVDFFFESGGMINSAVPVCIGEVTAEKLLQHTDAPFLTAKEHTANGIIEIIKENHR
ncbi:MAG: uroporphyrinogen-III synthase, partial [Ruminococcus sp.]|nr:uroporphyrinogen-III synthase [Ruminococcus sp.]